MRNFACTCGQRVFFYNSYCEHCQRKLGFDYPRLEMVALDYEPPAGWRGNEGAAFRLCRNYAEFNTCNWILPDDTDDEYCFSCRLSRTIPRLASPLQLELWGHLEMAKRHLLYNLKTLGLPVVGKAEDPVHGLAFDFLEDKRQNPNVDADFVLTGHRDGIITINLAEADDVRREQMRLEMGEAYRTLLGHLRHETGHYYFGRLVKNTAHHSAFCELFGTDDADYQQAIEFHYRALSELESTRSRRQGYITAYAEAHPLEDWAECWSHYLHMVDTMETAAEFGLVPKSTFDQEFSAWLAPWTHVTTLMNALNRSLGQKDPYPFVLSEEVVRKIQFVHRVVQA